MRQRAINRKTKTAAAAEIVASSYRLKKATNLLAAYLRDPENQDEPRLTNIGLFTEAEIRAIEMMAHKQSERAFDEDAFAKAMAMTTPVVARPRIEGDALDLWRVLQQPEMAEMLWADWEGRTGERGRDPGFLAKALAVLMATLGSSAHIKDNYRALMNEPVWRELFGWVEANAAAARGRKPQPFGKKCYERACEQIRFICDPRKSKAAPTAERCLVINRELYRWLRERYPEFGVRLGIDTCLTKAWIEQWGHRSPEKEAKIRERAPNASLRTIDGKNGSVIRSVNGYGLVVLSDLATGIPVVWGLFPAGEGSTDYTSLMTLLENLFAVDEDFPVKQIVADKAWSTEACVRDCAIRYGIHLITRLSTPTEKRNLRQITALANETIASYDGYGHVYCRQHGELMQRDGSDFLGREKREKLGLKPGDEAPRVDSNFRLRFRCPVGGGTCDERPSLPMSIDWRCFSYYPHTIEAGAKRLQAERLAMYARRNTCEAIFGALKVGHKLALESADRTHTAYETTVEALLSLALVFRTAVIVANERIRSGELLADPPPDLAAKLA